MQEHEVDSWWWWCVDGQGLRNNVACPYITLHLWNSFQFAAVKDSKCLLRIQILVTLQLVILASFDVTIVSVFPHLSGAMELLMDVVMAVMREDAVAKLVEY